MKKPAPRPAKSSKRRSRSDAAIPVAPADARQPRKGSGGGPSIAPAAFKHVKPKPDPRLHAAPAQAALRNADGRDSDGRNVDEYGLIPQHALFVKYYMLRHNATWAAKMAGYMPDSAHVQGCNLLKHPRISARIAQLRAEWNAKYAATQDNILRILALMAAFDIRDLYDDEGQPVPITQLDDAAGLALTGVESQHMEIEGDGDGQPTRRISTKKYRAEGRTRAIELLMKHLGMLKEGGPDKQDRLHEIVEALRGQLALPDGNSNGGPKKGEA